MSNACPSCGVPPIGGQIVELRHATTTDVTYGVICQNCGTVYESDSASEQMGEIHD